MAIRPSPINASQSKQIYKNNTKQFEEILNDDMLHVSDNIRSVYNPGQFIFAEISGLRLEVSRLGILVRINNEHSPAALQAYHSHIFSLLLPCSVVIPDNLWKSINDLWRKVGEEIETFDTARKAIPNKKIPKELIQKLDKLHRVCLLAAQKAGLGLVVEKVQDIDKSIENAITG